MFYPDPDSGFASVEPSGIGVGVFTKKSVGGRELPYFKSSLRCKNERLYELRNI